MKIDLLGGAGHIAGAASCYITEGAYGVKVDRAPKGFISKQAARFYLPNTL